MVAVVGLKQVPTLVFFSRGRLAGAQSDKKHSSAAGSVNKGHEQDVDSRRVS
jgi:hypothetical protein